jgi:hypothetical protein
MALRTFHPCAFSFRTTNIRRVGNIADDGGSISGYTDEIETDGGGYWLADFSDGFTRDKITGNAWRAITDLDAGEKMIVLGCAERRFQPVGALQTVTHDDATPFDDGTLYTSPGAQYAATADAALRATSMQYAGASELGLIGGELFSVQHPNWGWRWYRIRGVDDDTIYFRTPLREAVTAGTALEFDTPRCQMVLAAKVDNTLNLGRTGTCAISFKEDMSPPPAS